LACVTQPLRCPNSTQPADADPIFASNRPGSLNVPATQTKRFVLARFVTQRPAPPPGAEARTAMEVDAPVEGADGSSEARS